MAHKDQIFHGDFDTLENSIQHKLKQFGQVDTEYDEIKGRFDFKFHNFWSLKPNMFTFEGYYITTKIAENQYTIKFQIEDNTVPRMKKIITIVYIIAIILYLFTTYQLYQSPLGLNPLDILMPIVIFLAISGIYLLFQFLTYYIIKNFAKIEFKKQFQPLKLDIPFRVHLYSLKLLIFFTTIALGVAVLVLLSLNYLITHFLATS